MRVQDEDTWEAEYWDEYLREFGRAAYIEARYQAPSAVELEPGAYDSDDLDRIHSLSHERLRQGALVENFDAKQSRRGIPTGASWMGGRLDRGKPVELRAQHP